MEELSESTPPSDPSLDWETTEFVLDISFGNKVEIVLLLVCLCVCLRSLLRLPTVSAGLLCAGFVVLLLKYVASVALFKPGQPANEISENVLISLGPVGLGFLTLGLWLQFSDHHALTDKSPASTE